VDTCTKCGSVSTERGLLMVKGSTGWDIRFRRHGASRFSRKREVEAVACLACGHVELMLKDPPGERAGGGDGDP